jgi:type II secretory pathway pseudopilin PulG
MSHKAIPVLLAALAAGIAFCSAAEGQYSTYQTPYSPYQTYEPYQPPAENNPPAQTPYQPQYAPTGQYNQPQYAPTGQYNQPQYAPTGQYNQPQYAPTGQYNQPQYAPAQPGYTQLPADCMRNNAAAGAVTGGMVGAMVGGLAGRGRGALIGGLAGSTLGGLSGAQADARCQQIAIQIAYQQAAAQEAAYEQQLAPQATQRSGTLSLPDSAYAAVSTDYQTPSNGHRHRITVRRLNSFSEPASHQVCDTFTRIDVDLDASGNSSSTTARRCKGADGQWHDG